MNLNSLFSFTNSLALIGWLILMFLPFWKNRDQYVLSLVIVLLAVVYSVLILPGFNRQMLNDFGSLDGIARLFTNQSALLAGWIHYLAFDLLAGIYIIKNAAKLQLNHWIIAPFLLFTFLLGPFGLLLYTILRWVKTRKLFSEF